MHIVFLGNCQMRAMKTMTEAYVLPYEPITVDFVDAYNDVCDESYARLTTAECVMTQEAPGAPVLDLAGIPAGVPVHRVPVAGAGFLWPYQGAPHPLAPDVPRGNRPYEPEYNDRYLSQLIRKGVSPAEALKSYRALDIPAKMDLGRIRDLTMESLAARDAVCGTDCAGIIGAYLPGEKLFQSAFHFETRIARHLAPKVFEKIGFDTKYGNRVRKHLQRVPFIEREPPVHPSIARFFGMGWVKEETRYRFLWEGSFTFDEYVLRFMAAQWNATLQEGILGAEAGEFGAQGNLEAGLRVSPDSAVGHFWLARAREQDGDLAGAEAGFQRSVELDALQVESWRALREVLVSRRDWRAAVLAAERAVDLAAAPDGDLAMLEEIRGHAGV